MISERHRIHRNVPSPDVGDLVEHESDGVDGAPLGKGARSGDRHVRLDDDVRVDADGPLVRELRCVVVVPPTTVADRMGPAT